MKTIKSVICILLALCLAACAFAGCGKKAETSPGNTDPAAPADRNLTGQPEGSGQEGPSGQPDGAAQPLTVGMLRYTNAPAAVKAQQGVIDGLAAAGYSEAAGTLKLLRQDAGSPAECETMAKTLAEEKPALLFAVGAPAAKALLAAAPEIPTVFANVKDPAAAGLTGDQLTGVTDAPPTAEQMALLARLLPNVKTVAVLYSEGNAESEAQYEAAKAALAQKDVACVPVTVTSVSGLEDAFKGIKNTADAVYVPDDTVLGYSIVPLLSEAEKAGLPVIGATEDMVNGGALATYGPDHAALGRQAAALGVKLLAAGAADAAASVEEAKVSSYFVNGAALAKYGITLPEELAENAVTLP